MQEIDEKILKLMSERKTVEQGFKILMDNYQMKLYNHIRTYVENHDDTDDVLQNTFIKIYKNIAKFENRSSLYTWIFKIATNESLTFLEGRKKKINLSIEVHGHDFQALHSVDGDFAYKTLHDAISKLPQQQKTIFNLRYFEEMSYMDMSEAIGISQGALKASYHHAVRKIENYIKKLTLIES